MLNSEEEALENLIIWDLSGVLCGLQKEMTRNSELNKDDNGSNDSNQHVYCTYYMLVSVLSDLHILTQIMLTITLRSKCCYHSHFIKKRNWDTDKLSTGPMVTRLVSGGNRIFILVRFHYHLSLVERKIWDLTSTWW